MNFLVTHLLHKPTQTIITIRTEVWISNTLEFRYHPLHEDPVIKYQRNNLYIIKKDCIEIPQGIQLNVARILYSK